jgi:hypothetical protein
VVLLSEVGPQAAQKGPACHSCCLGNLETHGRPPSASGVVRAITEDSTLLCASRAFELLSFSFGGVFFSAWCVLTF